MNLVEDDTGSKTPLLIEEEAANEQDIVIFSRIDNACKLLKGVDILLTLLK